MLNHQSMGLSDRIRRVRRCGLDVGGVSLGVGLEASKAQARPSLTRSLPWIKRLPHLLLQHQACHACQHVPCQNNND